MSGKKKEKIKQPENKEEAKAEEKKKLKGLLVRTISGLVMAVIGFFALLFGGPLMVALTFFVTYAGVFELLRVFKLHKASMGVVTYIFTGIYNIAVVFQAEQFYVPIWIIYLLVMLTMYVIKYPKYEIRQMTSSFFSFFYVVVCLSFMYHLRAMEHGFWFVLLVIMAACGNDIFAYLIGMAFGKRQVFPNLSPKKTWAGFFGGIFGAALMGFIYASILTANGLFPAVNLRLIFPIICAIAAFPAIVGDLAASGIKRNYDVKDYSNLIPGHGGVMDRFDSMIFTAPIVYYLVQFLLKAYVTGELTF